MSQEELKHTESDSDWARQWALDVKLQAQATTRHETWGDISRGASATRAAIAVLCIAGVCIAGEYAAFGAHETKTPRIVVPTKEKYPNDLR